MPLAEAIRRSGLPARLVRKRIRERGWDPERALIEPVGARHRRRPRTTGNRGSREELVHTVLTLHAEKLVLKQIAHAVGVSVTTAWKIINMPEYR